MKKNIGFALVTCMLIAVIGFCVAGTVKGQEPCEEGLPESWYREEETRLLEDVKDYLNNSGYRNSGVTLTRVVDEDGNRAYKFTIHHSKIDRMEETQRRDLQDQLAMICAEREGSFPKEVCTFQYDFLILHDICAK